MCDYVTNIEMSRRKVTTLLLFSQRWTFFVAMTGQSPRHAGQIQWTFDIFWHGLTFGCHHYPSPCEKDAVGTAKLTKTATWLKEERKLYQPLFDHKLKHGWISKQTRQKKVVHVLETLDEEAHRISPCNSMWKRPDWVIEMVGNILMLFLHVGRWQKYRWSWQRRRHSKIVWIPLISLHRYVPFHTTFCKFLHVCFISTQSDPVFRRTLRASCLVHSKLSWIWRRCDAWCASWMIVMSQEIQRMLCFVIVLMWLQSKMTSCFLQASSLVNEIVSLRDEAKAQCWRIALW